MRPLLSLVILPVLLTSSLGAQGTAAGLDSVFAEQRGTDRPGCAVSVVQRLSLIHI